MKTLSLVGFFLFFSLTVCHKAALSADCTPITDAMARDVQESAEEADEVYSGLIQKPDMAMLEACIGKVSDWGGWLNLGMPSTKKLLSKLCGVARSTVQGELNELRQEFSIEEPLTGTSVVKGGVGKGYSSQRAEELAQQIWDNILK